jgi:hypothetical protein
MGGWGIIVAVTIVMANLAQIAGKFTFLLFNAEGLAGLAPLVGGLILAAVFVKSCIDLANPENPESGDSWFGLGPPLVIGVGFLLFRVSAHVPAAAGQPRVLPRRPEVVGPTGPPSRLRRSRPTRRLVPMAGALIVGYDGSDCARAALSQAVELARLYGTGVDRLRLRAARARGRDVRPPPRPGGPRQDPHRGGPPAGRGQRRRGVPGRGGRPPGPTVCSPWPTITRPA